jgi:dihydroxyacetone kinase-like protein
MQRILNNPDNIVDEMLEGFVKCHRYIVKIEKLKELVDMETYCMGLKQV